MSDIHQLLLKYFQNQNEVVKLIKKSNEENKESFDILNKKFSDTLSTAISMLHISEENVEQLNETMNHIKGISMLSNGDSNDFFSPFQTIIFDRIFEIISIEKDILLNDIKNDFVIHAFKNESIGVLRVIENENDRKYKEKFFIIATNYLIKEYDLSKEMIMFINSYFDLYLIFTTTKNNTRKNGFFDLIKQDVSNNIKSNNLKNTIPEINNE